MNHKFFVISEKEYLALLTRDGVFPLGGIKKIREKIESFCHEEYNKQKYKDENHLQKCIETGSDIFDRKVKKKKIDKNFFPKDLLKFMEENSTFYFGSKTTI